MPGVLDQPVPTFGYPAGPTSPNMVAPAPAAPAPAPGAEMQTEFLRVLEVVTQMCDHVVEYLEADRAERRMMVETLSELARALADQRMAGAVVDATARDPEVEAPRERIIGGSIDAGPEPNVVIDLEAATEAIVADDESGEMVVEVRCRFGDRWVDGFEICEVISTEDGPRYRLRRRKDGVVLPELFDAADLRHVETFDELNAPADRRWSRI
jgi:hypothetical protein